MRQALAVLLCATALSGCDDANATTPAAARKLVFMNQPATAIAGASIGPVVRVAIQDEHGNVDRLSSADVTLTLETESSTASLPPLLGKKTVKAIDGVATFTDLRVTKALPGYSLVASVHGVTPTRSQTFAVRSAPAVRLEFAIQPTTAAAGQLLAPAVWIAVRDRFGNFVSDSTTVSLSLADRGGANLVGTTTSTSSAGVVVFPMLRIDTPGVKLRLAAATAGLPEARSSEIEVR